MQICKSNLAGLLGSGRVRA